MTVEWKATPGYYLYKKRMGLAAATAGVTVGESVYPKGEIHKDEYFGEQEVFRGTFKVTAPLSGAKPGDTVALKLKWQGCADAGLCYPPSVWDANGDRGRGQIRHHRRQGFRSRQCRASRGTTNTSIPKLPSCSQPKRCRSTPCELNWRIADGYYLYKERIKLVPADAARPVGAIVLPKGESHYDEYFGEQEIYRRSLDGTFSVPPGAKTVDVNVTYQGCADAGLCYPPITKTLTVSLEGAPATIASIRSHVQRRRRVRLRAGQLRREDRGRQHSPCHGDWLPGRPADGLHALRAADGADSLGHHRRRRLEHVARRAASCCRCATSPASRSST